jgi:hypothetical protein
LEGLAPTPQVRAASFEISTNRGRVNDPQVEVWGIQVVFKKEKPEDRKTKKSGDFLHVGCSEEA